MTKNMNPSDVIDIDTDFVMDDAHEHCEDEMIVNTMLEHVFAGANHQMQAAIELTKMINPKSEDVFKTYAEALKVVIETSPVPHLLNVLGAELA